MRPLYLVELTAAVDAAGTEQVFRFANAGFATEPSDTPASTIYLPRLKRSFTVLRQMFTGSRTAGQSRTGFGEIVISNQDGELDALVGYSFDNRTVTVRAGEVGDAFTDLRVVFKGTARQVQFTASEIIVSLKDRLAELGLPHLSSVYGGTNSLPSGVDGVAGDIKGRYLPRTYGKVYQVSPPCVNTSRLIYQVSDGAISTVDAVYVGGVALSKGSDYTSQSNMESSAPSSGQFRVWPAGGMFRLGTAPAKQVTADVTQGATAADRTTAQVLKAMAQAAGITDISAADVTAMDTANSAVVGLYVDGSETTLQLMDQVAASAGAFFGFDAEGTLRMSVLTAPSGTAVATVRTWNTAALDRQITGDGLPTWRAKVRHSRYYTVQRSAVDSATDAQKSAIAQEYRSVVSEDATIKDQWLAAQTLERDTLLTADADASTEAARLLALYGVQHHVYLARGVQLTATQMDALDLNAVVSVEWPRFELDAGVLMRVIGIQADYIRNTADLTLWH